MVDWVYSILIHLAKAASKLFLDFSPFAMWGFERMMCPCLGHGGISDRASWANGLKPRGGVS